MFLIAFSPYVINCVLPGKFALINVYLPHEGSGSNCASKGTDL